MKQIVAITLALFILAFAALPAFAAVGADDQAQNASREDIDAEKTAKGMSEEKSAAKAKSLKLKSTDGTDSSGSGAEISKTSRSVSSANNRFVLAKNARQTTRTEGDYVALGDDAEVSRGVGGDVFAAGRNVLVTDDEELQNIAAAGANVNIHVKTARNIYVSGADVDIQADDGAAGVYVAGLSVTLAGTVQDAYVAALNANVSGTIAENLTIRANNVTFDPDATVGGEITIISKKRPDLPASIDPSKITYKTPGLVGSLKDGGFAGKTALQKIGMVLTVSGIVTAILLSLLLNAARGGFFRERALRFRKYFWRDMLLGLAGVIITPVVALLLLASVVGAAVGAILFVAYAVALYLAPIVSGVILGRLVFPKLNRFASGAIITCLIWLLMLVPYLGAAVSIATALFGVGSLITAIPPRKNKLQIRNNRNDSDGGAHDSEETPPVRNPA